jgi:hypothetical protein
MNHKAKVKLNNHFLNMYVDYRGKAPHILDFSTRWRCVISFEFQLFVPLETVQSQYLLDRILGRSKFF